VFPSKIGMIAKAITKRTAHLYLIPELMTYAEVEKQPAVPFYTERLPKSMEKLKRLLFWGV